MASPTACRVLTNVAAGGDVAGDDGVDHGSTGTGCPGAVHRFQPWSIHADRVQTSEWQGRGRRRWRHRPDLCPRGSAPDRPPRRHALSAVPNGPVQPRHPDRLAMVGCRSRSSSAISMATTTSSDAPGDGKISAHARGDLLRRSPGRFSGAGSWPAPAPVPAHLRPPGPARAAHGRTGRASWWPGGGRGDRPPS